MKTTLITIALTAVATLAATPTTQDPTSHAVVYQARQRLEVGPGSIGTSKVPTYLDRQRIELESKAIGSGKFLVYQARQRIEG